MKKIVIFGTGGFSKECYWLTQCVGLEIDSFIDLKEKEDFCEHPVKTIQYFDPSQHKAVVAVGDPSLRKKIVNELNNLNVEFQTLIHPSAQFSKTVKIGKGSIICSNVVMTYDISIGDFVIANLNSTIGHDNIIGNFVTISPGSNISGCCNIGNNTYLGTNSSVLEGISISDNIIIGANACVTKNLTLPGTYIGVPAKMLIPKPIKEI